MARIKPFKGVRPPREYVEKVASRPYDVLNSEEARIEAQGNPMSLYHIIKPEIDFAPGTDEHDPKVYERARAELQGLPSARMAGSGSRREILPICPNYGRPYSVRICGSSQR